MDIVLFGAALTLTDQAKLAAEIEDDGEPFEEKMARLTTTLDEQFKESAKLEEAIRGNLKELGYGE